MFRFVFHLQFLLSITKQAGQVTAHANGWGQNMFRPKWVQVEMGCFRKKFQITK